MGHVEHHLYPLIKRIPLKSRRLLLRTSVDPVEPFEKPRAMAAAISILFSDAPGIEQYGLPRIWDVTPGLCQDNFFFQLPPYGDLVRNSVPGLEAWGVS